MWMFLNVELYLYTQPCYRSKLFFTEQRLLRPELTWVPFYWHGLTLIPAWMSKHMISKVWNEITYSYTSTVQPTIEF